ncbi:protein GVQW3 [Trichonephila clavipes]|nr:protein GVQW3 [Trichonephila clavipes]
MWWGICLFNASGRQLSSSSVSGDTCLRLKYAFNFCNIARWSVSLYAIKFCVRLGKNATETFQMLQEAFKDDCISRSQSGKWHKAFKEGREEVADEPHSGRPTTARTEENVDRVGEVLRTDRRLSIQQISDTLHMSTFAVLGIVTEDLKCVRTATAGSDVVQSERPIFDDFFQHLWPYIGNNTTNAVFQMVKRLWLIRIDQ